VSNYVDKEYLKLVGALPARDIDELDVVFPGTVDGISEAESRKADARLAKRYATPFQEPYPEALRSAVAYCVVYRLYQKRGPNPGSALEEAVLRDYNEAKDWFKEAANSKDGLIELPPREDGDDDKGVVQGGPLCVNDLTPYDAMQAQAEGAYGR